MSFHARKMIEIFFARGGSRNRKSGSMGMKIIKRADTFAMDDYVDLNQADPIDPVREENKFLRKRINELETIISRMKEELDQSSRLWTEQAAKFRSQYSDFQRSHERKLQENLETIKSLNDNYKQLKHDVNMKDREIRRMHEQIQAWSELEAMKQDVSPQNSSLSSSGGRTDRDRNIYRTFEVFSIRSTYFYSICAQSN